MKYRVSYLRKHVHEVEALSLADAARKAREFQRLYAEGEVVLCGVAPIATMGEVIQLPKEK